MEQKYHEEQDKRNIEKMRAVLSELPTFCKQYFHDITEYTSTRTRLAYAYDLRVFFQFIHDNNPICGDIPIKDYPLKLLEQITKDDIMEYLD